MTATLTLSGPGWATRDSVSARGQAHDAAGRLLRAVDLAERFASLVGEAEWMATAAGINGCFAVVQATGSAVRAAVDRIRSIPLFFASTGDALAVSDTAELVRRALVGPKVDDLACREFALTGYVTGADTLVEGLRQLPAGHCLFGRPNAPADAVLKRYFEFRHEALLSDGEAVLHERLLACHERVFRRLLSDLGERPIILPLSGGYDSRLIAVMLRDLGRRDVLCFCYGAPGNWESDTSREVAEHLGFRWTMVPYTAERWRECAATAEFRHYFRDAGNLASVPHIQDWPAVRELGRLGALREGSVFIPGHTGDFLTGNHIPKWFPERERIGRAELLRSILDAHYSLWEWRPDRDDALRSRMQARIEAIVGPTCEGTPEAAADLYERWEWQERQAKFIVNSVRVYEAFGCEWRLPWWDAELMDFWSHVPIHMRVGRSLFLNFVARHHPLPVRPPNADRPELVAALLRLVNRSRLQPLAKRAQHAVRRVRWRHHYERDPMAWFALVERQQFRRLYTGREIGHSFFARQYLDMVLA